MCHMLGGKTIILKHQFQIQDFNLTGDFSIAIKPDN